MIEISSEDQTVSAVLSRLLTGLQNPRPAMMAIGEDVTAISKQSFDRSASPDGDPWKPNSEVTLLHYLGKSGGNYRQDGRLSGKGTQRAMGKKPLIGDSRDLSRQFGYLAEAYSVMIYSTMPYAAMQQFGGTKAEFPHLWGDIPARQFMPLDDSGELSPAGQKTVLDAVNEYLEGLIS